MKLTDAQKHFDDAIEMSMTFNRHPMTEQEVTEFVTMVDKERKILYCETSKTKARCIFSRKAYLEEQRQMQMVIGAHVKMTGDESRFYPGKIWTVKFGPQMMCGDIVVWLDGFSGAYACKYLELIESSENAKS